MITNPYYRTFDTTEHETGKKWIDGSPIYEKTIIQNNIPVGKSNSNSFPHGVSNFNRLINVIARMETTESNYDNLVYRTSDYKADSSNVYTVYSKGNWGAKSERTWYFTIQYTKTS